MTHSERVALILVLVVISVKGMLPKNTLGHQEFMKMHVYAGEDHKHEAQKPEKLDINKLI